MQPAEPGAEVINANALDLPLPDESVDLIITSPPYFALRSYRDGDEHYGGQIGSEPTPQDFLEALWAATAEMVRVLKPSGSIWVNLGDSYAGSGGYNNSNIGADGRGPAAYKWNKRGKGSQGRTPEWTEANAAWLAGVIDSDGSISCHINGERSFVPWVRIGQMDSEAVHEAERITGVGRVFQDGRGVWNWNAASQQAGYVLARIWPYLRIKQKQALAAIELCNHVSSVGASGKKGLDDEQLAYRHQIREAILGWNQRTPTGWEPPTAERLALPQSLDWKAKAKSLNGLPWRYAIGCIDQLGLILRAEVIWSKPNGLPESVTDRVRRSHEQWFHFTKQGRYFSAVDEVREAHAAPLHAPGNAKVGDIVPNNTRPGHMRLPDATWGHPLGKLPGSVWTVPSEPLIIPDAVKAHYDLPDHFAAFPQEWPRRIILGWSPSGVCVACGEGRRPVVERTGRQVTSRVDGAVELEGRNTTVYGGRSSDSNEGNEIRTSKGPAFPKWEQVVTGYACACTETLERIWTSPNGVDHAIVRGSCMTCGKPHPLPPTRPAVVLDPFGGTGTVAMVARALGRYGISVDLSQDYCRLAEWRIFQSGHGDNLVRKAIESGAMDASQVPPETLERARPKNAPQPTSLFDA